MNKTRESILAEMDLAARQDRDRFFAKTDAMLVQPKYVDHLVELEEERQKWRDMTDIEGYPAIKFPLDLPEWFPEIKFASRWDSSYLEGQMEEGSLE